MAIVKSVTQNTKDTKEASTLQSGILEDGSRNNSLDRAYIGQGVAVEAPSPIFFGGVGMANLPKEAGKDVGVGGGGTKVHTWKKVGIALVRALRKAGLGYEADEIENCGTTFVTYRCGYCGTYFGLPITCKQRLCSRCSSARAEDIWERHKDKLLKARKPKHLILTLKSVEHISPEYIRWVFACWNKLWHRKFFKQAVYGVLVSVEFTHTPGVGWHPHLHCYLSSEYVPKEDIEKAWCEITGGAYVCRIKKVRGKWHKAIKEIVKYPTKVVGFYQEPELLSEFVEATKCVHLVRGYGEFYKIRHRKHLKRGEVRCPVCGKTDYLEKIGDYEPLANFVREQWGWRFKPGGVVDGMKEMEVKLWL